MIATQKSRDFQSWYFFGAAITWFVLYWTARFLLKGSELETWIRVTIALAPIIPFALVLFLVVRGLKQLDELQQRIQLEALAIAFLLTMLMLMTLALMQRAVTLKFEDWSYAHVAIYPFIFYFGSLAIAHRRYQ